MTCLASARENAGTVRDMISSQMWEEFNKFYLMVRDARKDDRVLASPFEFFDKVKLGGSLLEGVAESTMSWPEAWHFRRMGLSLELADQTSRILDVKIYLLLPSVADVGTPVDSNQWVALLKSVSALEMYRKKYGRIIPTQVAEFLILDRDFPRTLTLAGSARAVAAGHYGRQAGHVPDPRPTASGPVVPPISTTPTSTRSSPAVESMNSSTPSRRG